jgi:hypothetical protein
MPARGASTGALLAPRTGMWTGDFVTAAGQLFATKTE